MWMPFLMYMLLGRTIDLKSYEIGGDIFDNAHYDEIKLNTFNTTYAVLQDNAFPYDGTGYQADLVLRIKSGYSLSSDSHLDKLLRETTWKQRSVVVIVASVVQTMQRSLRDDAQPLPNWNTRVSSSQTHYAKSLVYGGLTYVLYRFKCDIPGDVETVRRTLTAILGVHGHFGPATANLWQKALNAIAKDEEIRGEVNVHVHTYSTFPFQTDVTTFPKLLKALEEVPQLVGAVGKPIAMELLPLHTLDSKYPLVEEKHELDRQLEELDEMYDDVKNTKDSVTRWVDETSTFFSEEDETKVADLVAHLSACLKLFHRIANEASIYKQMDAELIQTAIDLYNRDLTHYSYTYDRMFRKLKEDIDAECENTFLHKIKGLLQVDDSERIELGQVEGGLEECKMACLAAPSCRSIGYVDRLSVLKKIKTTLQSSYQFVLKTKLCYVYFRSSSTADVISPTGASVTAVYDRKCS